MSVTLGAPFISSARKKVEGKGIWNVRIRPAFEAPTYTYNLFVDADNRTIASEFTADQPTKGVGQPIRLRAKLLEGGNPVTGLPAGSVTAIVSAPGSGLGNVLSAANVVPVSSPSGDPVDLASRKARAMLIDPGLRPTLLAALNASPTPTVTLSEVQPGVYEANYTATDQEGIYPVTFLADFQTPGNGRVTRTFTVSYYVPVVPNAEASLSGAVVQAIAPCSQPGGCYTITFTPADARGNLAWPGKAPLIYIASANGVNLGLEDFGDGSYKMRVGSLGPPGVPPVINYGNVSINTAQAVGALRRPIELVLPYAGFTVFDNNLH